MCFKIDNLMELETLISQVERVFPYENIEKLNLDEGYTNKYYNQSNYGYRFVHSNQGSVHMALSQNGNLREDDYLNQVRTIEQKIKEINKKSFTVLELGCGKGYNIEYLGKRFKNANFTGIDITREHIKQAIRRTKKLENVSIQYMSFDDFCFQGQKFDLIFEIESICHSVDQPKLINNIYNLLKTNGEFVAFEGFRNTSGKQLKANEIKLLNYIEKSMAVAKGVELNVWMQDFKNTFDCVSENDISKQIIPNLKKFNKLAGKYFRRPRIAKFINLFMPTKLVMNAIAGYLMLFSVTNKYHVYYRVEGKK